MNSRGIVSVYHNLSEIERMNMACYKDETVWGFLMTFEMFLECVFESTIEYFIGFVVLKKNSVDSVH